MQLSTDDKSRIHAAIAAAEAHSQVHVAVSVVPASDRYLLYPLVWGAVLALVSGAVVALGWPGLALREAFAIEAGVFIVLSLVLDWQPLRFRLVPRHIRRHHAQALAQREFAARILSSSVRTGGVLFFVSLGERYAEIRADRDTHARVGAASWNKFLADYTAAAKQGRVADGVVAAIESCSAVL